ncbi:MAG: CheR family methyltransferase [Vulcanimicrobiota bacterium]
MDRLRSVGETHFFRHPAQFEHLQKFVRAPGFFRIWSAGCANGAEIYSAVLLLAQKGLGRFHFSASDFNLAALDAARTGRFTNWHLRGCSAGLRDRFFRPLGEDWQLDPEIVGRVDFFQHDLVDGPELEPQDVIFCRNVLIYMDPPTMAAVVDRLYRWLAPEGILYLGYSEAVLAGDHPGLELVDSSLAAYRRKPLQLSTLPVPVLLPPIPLEPMRIKPRPAQLAGRPEALELLAEAAQYASQDQPRQASRSLKRSLYLDPSLAVSHYQLGLLELGEGRPAQAQRHWRNVIELARRQPAEDRVPGWESCNWGQLLQWTSRQLQRLGENLRV